MRKLSLQRVCRVVFSVVITTLMIIQLFQPLSVMAKSHIREYSNETGEYFGEDLIQPEVARQSEVGLVENPALIGRTTFSQTNMNLETPITTENEGEIIERPDEFTVIKELDDEGLKSLEVYTVPVNYEEDGVMKGIETTIQVRNPEVVEEATILQNEGELSTVQKGLATSSTIEPSRLPTENIIATPETTEASGMPTESIIATPETTEASGMPTESTIATPETTEASGLPTENTIATPETTEASIEPSLVPEETVEASIEPTEGAIATPEITEDASPVAELTFEEKYPYFNNENVYRTDFPLSVQDGILLSKEGTIVTIIPEMEENLVPELLNNEIVYPGVKQQSIRYAVGNQGLKEEVVLYAPSESNRFISTLNIEGGRFENVDGQVLVIGQSGLPIFVVSAPSAYDAAGNTTDQLSVRYEEGQMIVEVDNEWLSSESRVYPIVIDPIYNGMAHQAVDVTVASDTPNATIGAPNLAASGWKVNNVNDAYLAMGQKNGTSYSYYWPDTTAIDFMRGKYLKSAKYYYTVKSASKDNTIYACPVQQTVPSYNSVTWNNKPTNIGTCVSAASVTPGSVNTLATFDITETMRGVIEGGETNNGFMMTLADMTGVVELYGHEYYYLNGSEWGYLPFSIFEYYDSAEVNPNLTVVETTMVMHPYVDTNYTNVHAQFIALGFSGIAKKNSLISINIKDQNNQFVSSGTYKTTNHSFFTTPDYNQLELNLSSAGYNTQKYPQKTGNWQYIAQTADGSVSGIFQKDILYKVSFMTMNEGMFTKIQTFRLVEVKRFDLLQNIASFYGVSVEQLVKDNNLSDELIKEGNLIFVANPTLNATTVYPHVELSDGAKQIVNEYLRGRNGQNEYLNQINVNTGNFNLEEEDFKFSVNDTEIGFKRNYNSHAASELGSMGWGMRHNFEYNLAFLADGVGVQLPDGTRITFRWDNGTFTAVNTKEYTLTRDVIGFTLKNRYNTYTFDTAGKMIEEINHLKESTRYEYTDGYLSKVTFSNDQSLMFYYGGAQHLLTQVVKFDGTSVQYGYDAEGNLISVQDETLATARYEYNANHLMIKVYDKLDRLVKQQEYDTQNRVVLMKNSREQATTVSYFEGYTESIDYRGDKRIVYFDEYNQTYKIVEPNGRIATRQWDMGWLKETKENGVVFTYNYDYKGNLTEKVRVIDGAKETYEYDSNNNLIKKTDMMGYISSYQYDDRNNLLKEINAENFTTTYTYRGGEDQKTKNQMISKTDAMGYVTTYEYDENGYQNKIIYADGSFEKMTNTKTGEIAAKTDRQGDLTTYTRNQRGDVTLVRNPDGTYVDYEVNGEGDIVSTINENRVKTTYEVDVNGNKTKQVDGNGNVTTWQYDSRNNLVKATYADGSVDEFVFDSEDRIIEQRIKGVLTTYTYNEYGVNQEVNHRGQTKHTYYTSTGFVSKIINFDGTIETNTYDKIGNLTSKTDIFYNKTTFSYNGLNKVITQVDQRGNSTTFTYDRNQNLTSTLLQGTSGIKDTSFVYDNMGQMLKKTDAMGFTEQYVYKNGELIQTTNANGISKRFEMDGRGRIVKTIFYDGTTETSRYDGVGSVVFAIDRASATTVFEYDASGNNISVTNDVGYKTRNSYDKMNRLIKTISHLGYTEEFEYDTRGNKTLVKVNGIVQETTQYNHDNQVMMKTDRLGQSTTYAYNTSGRIIKETSPTGVVLSSAYNWYGQLSRITRDGIIQSQIEQDDYNIIYKTDLRGNAETYTYDSFNQLTRKISATGVVENYRYNAKGQVIFYADWRTVTDYTYDGAGQLIEETMNDHTSQYVYNGDGAKVEVINALGQTAYTTYSPTGLVLSQTDEQGNVTTFEYDSLGQKVKTIFPDQGVETIVYNADGLVTKTTNPMGYSTQIEYDEFRNVVKEVNERGFAQEYVYNNLQQVTKKIGLDQSTTNYTYDSLGRVISEQNAAGHTTVITYDKYNNVTEVKAPDNSITKTTYNQYNEVESIENSVGYIEYKVYDQYGRQIQQETRDLTTIVLLKKEYDKYNRVIKETDSLGNVESYVYDIYNNVIKKTEKNGAVTVMEYDQLNRLISSTDWNQVKNQVVYDAVGNPITTLRNGIVMSTNTYDRMGRVLNAKDNLGNSTITVYNKNGNPVQVKDKDDYITKFSYDACGNQIEMIQPNGAINKTVYDKANRVIQTADGLGNKVTTTYDNLGQILDVQDAKGAHTSYTYDKVGNKTKEDAAALETTKTYNSNHQVTKITYPTGKSESFEYAKNGDLLKVVQKNGEIINYTYNQAHQVISTITKSETTSYTYDVMGKVVQTKKGTEEIKTSYDLSGNILSNTQNGSTVTYQYDELGRLSKMIYPSLSEVNYVYNKADQLVEVFDTEGVKTTYKYTRGGKAGDQEIEGVMAIRTWYNGLGLISNLYYEDNEGKYCYRVYDYDLAGNLIRDFMQIVKEGKVLRQDIVTYTYNERNEVTSEKKATSAGIEESVYSYDLQGNRLTISGNQGKVYNYNDDGQLTMITEGSEVTRYTYNDQGDITKETNGSQEKLYTYNDYNKLVEVKDFDGTIIKYTYDARGNRISEEITKEADKISINYINDINRSYPEVIAMTKNSKLLEYSYGHKRINMNKQYYLYDGLGSVSELIDQDQNIIEEYNYTMEGQREYNPYVQDNMYGYRAEAHTGDGQQYLRARYYDPNSGRFIQWDTYAGENTPISRNRYTYAENNANKYSDPSGHAVVNSQADLEREEGWAAQKATAAKAKEEEAARVAAAKAKQKAEKAAREKREREAREKREREAREKREREAREKAAAAARVALAIAAGMAAGSGSGSGNKKTPPTPTPATAPSPKQTPKPIAPIASKVDVTAFKDKIAELIKAEKAKSITNLLKGDNATTQSTKEKPKNIFEAAAAKAEEESKLVKNALTGFVAAPTGPARFNMFDVKKTTETAIKNVKDAQNVSDIKNKDDDKSNEDKGTTEVFGSSELVRSSNPFGQGTDGKGVIKETIKDNKLGEFSYSLVDSEVSRIIQNKNGITVIPDHMNLSAFYLNGQTLTGDISDFKYNTKILEVNAGLVSVGFQTDKFFKGLPENSLLNPSLEANLSALKAEASISGSGISAKASLVSLDGSIEFGDSIKVGGELYLGVGFVLDLSDGVRFGFGFFEVSIKVDWRELFN